MERGYLKMGGTVNIGIIGDYDRNHPSHQATDKSLLHAAKYLQAGINISWLPTPSLLTKEGQPRQEQFDGIWAAPGGAYQSIEGALRGIQLAREANQPFLGT